MRRDRWKVLVNGTEGKKRGRESLASLRPVIISCPAVAPAVCWTRSLVLIRTKVLRHSDRSLPLSFWTRHDEMRTFLAGFLPYLS